jgi:hypothetical protein
MTQIQQSTRDDIPIVRLLSASLQVEVAPEVGGRIVSIMDRASGHEFLWRNAALPLECLSAGSEYDPHFYGGVDELLPNDMPEVIDGVACPDHGELWTTRMKYQVSGDRLCLTADLPRCGLHCEREMTLRADGPWIDFRYRLTNRAGSPRQFLWKLHAALNVRAGDLIECPAKTGQVVDLAWSRYSTLDPFPWPTIQGQAANVIPGPNGTVDFFYLYGLSTGQIAWLDRDKRLRFAYHFDTRIFPYAWLFASYGGFNGHYTVILEPCTTMPISVNEAAAKGQCAQLQQGEQLETKVSIYAGPA